MKHQEARELSQLKEAACRLLRAAFAVLQQFVATETTRLMPGRIELIVQKGDITDGLRVVFRQNDMHAGGRRIMWVDLSSSPLVQRRTECTVDYFSGPAVQLAIAIHRAYELWSEERGVSEFVEAVLEADFILMRNSAIRRYGKHEPFAAVHVRNSLPRIRELEQLLAQPEPPAELMVPL